jgi:hypothetical protein
MKKTIAAILLLTSSLSFAQDLSVEEYFDLFKTYKEAYEKVEPGMTAEYRTNYFRIDENKNEIECFQHKKEVVVSAERPDYYLVYTKIKNIGNCGETAAYPSDTQEYLAWREMEYIDVPASDRIQHNVVKFHKITRNGHFTHAQGTLRDRKTGEDYPYMVKRDHSKSQFYNLVEDKWINYTIKLVKRSFTDPDSIHVETLEIINQI